MGFIWRLLGRFVSFRGLSRLQRKVISLFETRGGVGKSLSLMGAGLALTLFAVDRLQGFPVDPGGWMELLIVAVGCGSWLLLKRGRFAFVVWLMVSTLFLIAAASAYFYGSARTVNIFLIVAGQVVVGLFLSRKALVWTTVAAVALLCGMSWADTSGLLLGDPTFKVDLRTWGAQAAALAGVSMMVYANRTQLRVAQERLIREAKQRLQAERERDDGLDRFKLVFGSSPTPIFVQSARTGDILDANPAFEAVTGYRRKQVLNRKDGFLWVKDVQLEVFERNRRNQLRTDWLPVQCLRRDGTSVAMLICSEVDKDPEDSLIITVLRLVDDGVALPSFQATEAGDLLSDLDSIDD